VLRRGGLSAVWATPGFVTMHGSRGSGMRRIRIRYFKLLGIGAQDNEVTRHQLDQKKKEGRKTDIWVYLGCEDKVTSGWSKYFNET